MATKKQLKYLREFTPAANVVLYSQFAEYLREAIQSGLFPGGEKLPSLRTISKESGVNYYSVQLATEELTKEGQLYKVHGKGMIVRDQIRRSETVGIFSKGDLTSCSTFLHMLVGYIGSELNKRGFEIINYFDHRKPEEAGKVPKHFDAMIKSNRLSALIALTLNSEDRDWFERLTIPHYESKDLQHPINAVEHYAPLKTALESGTFERPLLLFPKIPDLPHPDSTIGKQMREAGIDVTRYPCIPVYGGNDYDSFAAQAYDVLKRELRKSRKPDLLFIFPEDSMPGAVAAILEAGIRVPEQMTVFCHRNLEIPVFAPFPVTFLDVSIKDYADKLLNRITI